MKTLIQAAEERIAENEAQLNELLEEEAENILDADAFENKILSDGSVKKKLKELKGKANTNEEVKVLERYLNLKEEIADTK